MRTSRRYIRTLLSIVLLGIVVTGSGASWERLTQVLLVVGLSLDALLEWRDSHGHYRHDLLLSLLEQTKRGLAAGLPDLPPSDVRVHLFRLVRPLWGLGTPQLRLLARDEALSTMRVAMRGSLLDSALSGQALFVRGTDKESAALAGFEGFFPRQISAIIAVPIFAQTGRAPIRRYRQLGVLVVDFAGQHILPYLEKHRTGALEIVSQAATTASILLEDVE